MAVAYETFPRLLETGIADARGTIGLYDVRLRAEPGFSSALSKNLYRILPREPSAKPGDIR